MKHFFLFVSGLLLAAAFSPQSAAFDPNNEHLKADWLFQADNQPTAEKTAAEIKFTRELADRLKEKFAGLDLSKELAQLGDIENNSQLDTAAKYLKVREIKRTIAFKNPLINFSRILLIDNPYPLGKPGDITNEWDHEARHRNGYMAENGGRLITVGLHPGSEVKDLIPDFRGSYWRPDVSFDGKEILVSYRPVGEKSFHLYKLNADGSGLKQLTQGDYDDLDPIFTPEGKIVFCSSRQGSYVRCMPMTHSFALSRCDNDGKNIYVISANGEPEYLPTMLNDGRVGFTRWEYTDKALWRVQSLWSANPDGTQQQIYWGNHSVWPDVLTEMRAIPNSTKIMFAGVGHHAWFNGSIGIIDNSKGLDYPEGLDRVTRDVAWAEVGNGPADPADQHGYHSAGKFASYKSPYPLSEEYFIVSAREQNNRNHPFRLYLMDVYGNKELIYRGNYNAYYAMPFSPRFEPPVRPDNVSWPVIGSGEKPKPGLLVNPNVFDGLPKGTADRVKKEAKALRVIQMDPKTYTTWHKIVQHDGPAVGVTQAEGVKRILGETPIESDGSVAFEIPPGEAVYFELLDSEGRAIHVMRTFTYVMPGEVRGCFGCHEGTSLTGTGKTVGAVQGKAFSRTNHVLVPPPWEGGAGTSVSFNRFVQPVLDKYCAKCHQDPDSKAYQTLNMTNRPSRHSWRDWTGSEDNISPFTEPYLTLVTGNRQRTAWGGENERTMPRNELNIPINLAGIFIVEGYGANDPASLATLPPYSTLSTTSKLVDNAISGKHGDGVKVTGVDKAKLIAWVDANGPYLGDEEIRNDMYDPVANDIENIPAVRPRVATAPKINRFNLRQDGDSTKVFFVPEGAVLNDRELKINPKLDPKSPQYNPRFNPNTERNIYFQKAGFEGFDREKEIGKVNVEIVKAFYGKNETEGADVTKALLKYFDGTRFIPLGKYNDAFGDPMKNVIKQLLITYKIDGVEKKQSFGEDTLILLQK